MVSLATAWQFRLRSFWSRLRAFTVGNRRVRASGAARLASALAAWVGLWLSCPAPAAADHLPPVHPVFPGTNHDHEDHSADNHNAEDWAFTSFIFADLSLTQLASANLIIADLSNADLSNANLSNANLLFADLSSANLSGADLSGAFLFLADLRNTVVSEAITAVQLQSATNVIMVNLSGNDMTGFNLSGLGLNSANLSFADLSGADLSGADLRNTVVSEAITAVQLQSAWNVTSVNLSGNDMTGFDLSGPGLAGANLSFANVTSADLSGADLFSADLRNTVVSEAITVVQLQSASNVSGVNLSGNDLTGFNLSGLGLSNANLSFADLSSANLSTTDLSTTDLSGTDLSGADLTDANLHLAILPSALPSLPVIGGATVNVNGSLGVVGQTNVAGAGHLNIISAGSFSTGSAISAGTLLVFGTPSVDFGTGLTNNGDLVLQSTTVEGPVYSPTGFPINVIGNVTFNGLVSGAGGIFGSGTAIFNGGHNPGDSPAVFTVENDVEYGSSNTLEIELGGTTPGTEHDQLDVGGDLSAGGTLNVTLIDAGGGVLVPGAGDIFDIFNFSTFSGDFTTMNLPSLAGSDPDLRWHLNKLRTTGELLATFIADLNGDVIVDIADLGLIGGQWGTDGLGFPSGFSADINGDGVVDVADLGQMGGQWGLTANTSFTEGASVPAPGAAALGTIGLAVLAGRRRRR